MRKNTLFFAVMFLAIFGILLAAYLFWEQVSRSGFQPCNINVSVNCNAIISGPVAKTFGVSTPLIGLTGYIVIFLAALLQKRKLLVGMATCGLLFCLWIAYQELFFLHVICPVCILCQLTMISEFTLGILLLRKKKGGE